MQERDAAFSDLEQVARGLRASRDRSGGERDADIIRELAVEGLQALERLQIGTTHPDQLGVRPLSIEEVGRIVLGRIKTAFAPIGNIVDPETQRKAEWVVNGIEKWGEVESHG